MPIKAIITGATGMVGEGVLLDCLDHPDVEQVLTLAQLGALQRATDEVFVHHGVADYAVRLVTAECPCVDAP